MADIRTSYNDQLTTPSPGPSQLVHPTPSILLVTMINDFPPYKIDPLQAMVEPGLKLVHLCFWAWHHFLKQTFFPPIFHILKIIFMLFIYE